MTATGVVPALDEVEEREPGVGVCAEAMAVKQLALGVAKKLSHIALSYASPTLPIDGRTHASRHRVPKAMAVYWQPWSGW
jgi:hypothetical protein